MSHRLTQSDLFWLTAQNVCTPKQLVVLELRERGFSLRMTALATGQSVSTVRDHLAAAQRNVDHALNGGPR